MRLCVGVLALFATALLISQRGDNSAASATARNFDIYSVSISGKTKRNLTRSPLDELAPAVSPDGRRVVFVRATTRENWDLWIMRADGSDQRQLTHTEDAELDPVWSPDGRLIAFTTHARSSCPPSDCGDWLLWVMRPDGTGLRPIGREVGEGRYPRWSPDGKKLVFEAEIDSYGQATAIAVARVSGGSHLLVSGGSFHHPGWSPDGRWISFDGLPEGGRFGVFAVKLDGQSRRLLAGGGLLPEWSPAGGKIAFRSSSERADVTAMSLRSRRRTRIGLADRFAWDRAGRRLALFRSGRSIRIADSDGRRMRLVLRNPGAFEPAHVRPAPDMWSPDGRRLFYAAKPSG